MQLIKRKEDKFQILKLIKRKDDKLIMNIKKNDIIIFKDILGTMLHGPCPIKEPEFKEITKFDREAAYKLSKNLLDIRDGANIIE